MKRCVIALLLMLALGLAPAAVTAHALHMAAGALAHGAGPGHAPAANHAMPDGHTMPDGHAMSGGHAADCGGTAACRFGAAACAWVCSSMTALQPAAAPAHAADTLGVVHPRAPALLREGEAPPISERPPEPFLL
ncbi:hypothetical protein [Rhodobacteraceae bacterium DSL-40]|uniref:hypothetical protein n=1 Tax=Amaricoccus sp. B4 TaxID=3368557 RepID=UPI000DAECBCF